MLPWWVMAGISGKFDRLDAGVRESSKVIRIYPQETMNVPNIMGTYPFFLFFFLFSPFSSILLPVTQKSIWAHHLEGCVNSLNGPWGEMKDERGCTGVSFAGVYPAPVPGSNVTHSWDTKTMVGSGLQMCFFAFTVCVAPRKALFIPHWHFNLK